MCDDPLLIHLAGNCSSKNVQTLYNILKQHVKHDMLIIVNVPNMFDEHVVCYFI